MAGTGCCIAAWSCVRSRRFRARSLPPTNRQNMGDLWRRLETAATMELLSSKPSLIFAREEYVQVVRAALPGVLVVKSRAELVAAMKHRSLVSAFVDFDLLPHLDGLTFEVPIVALVDDTLS